MADSDLERNYVEATRMTAGDLLHTIVSTANFAELSALELPEIQRLTQEVARVVPAGNVPGLILNGLARLDGRTVDPTESQKHIGLLFKGIRVTLDKALYSTFFMGPAAVLYGYQQLLRLAGKDLDSAFPEGTWQFYLQFALREDSARHANETTGFQFRTAALYLNDVDRLAVWLVAVALTVRQLPELLANEWRERVLLRVLVDVARTHRFRNLADLEKLYHRWEGQRPYERVTADEPLSVYRRRKFDALIEPHLRGLRGAAREDFERQWQTLESTRLPAYQQQLSWLAYLHPDTHSETRVPYRPDEAQIGIVWQGRYYLHPLLPLVDMNLARRTAASVLESTPAHPPATLDSDLLLLPREQHEALRKLLPAADQNDLHRLRYMPVLLNMDRQDSRQPLALIRRGKRGFGDHPLTIFQTQDSTVFDQSHIFFDGAWGSAIAQIITNEAIFQAEHLKPASHAQGGRTSAVYSPPLQSPPRLTTTARKFGSVPEAAAENDQIQLKSIQGLRIALRQRSDQAHVTVNDLFILYRALHALLYQPSPTLAATLKALSADKRAGAAKATQVIREALERQRTRNPAILIPIDASRHDPRERVFPTTFWNPLTEFLQHHQATLAALAVWEANPRGRGTYQQFEKLRAEYLRLIAGFGELLAKYKDIALRGQSPGTLSIKALAHLPPQVQRWFNGIPGKFDVMNEVIKGEEVFSNVGRVVPGSSLRRFITAKDDNDQKTLCWGALTDDRGTVHLSLRDFRPHVRVLYELKSGELAQQLAQDYLDAYADGLNRYIDELMRITKAGQR